MILDFGKTIFFHPALLLQSFQRIAGAI